MSELRQDRTTGAWVIIAPERRRRSLPQSARSELQRGPRFDPSCPFCPGSESELPGIIEETPADGLPGWQVRVVPNKYPALRPEPAAAHDFGCGRAVVAGYGFHEVIIESPRHDVDLAVLSDWEREAVLSAYRRRFVALAERPRIESVILFRNYGAASGASLMHPHTQLIALALTPPGLQSRFDWAAARYRDHGRCVLCDEIELERISGDRVVEESDPFIALVPFASAYPFEQWLIPKRHQESFAEISSLELGELGRVLGRALQRLQTALGDRPYNIVVESVVPSHAGRPHLHWRLRIVPNVVTPGGFELASGMAINASRPEDDATILRRAGAAP